VQPLQRLAIEHLALGPAWDMPRLARLDQQHFEAARLQQLKQWDPVDAGRFHDDGPDAAGRQPIGQELAAHYGISSIPALLIFKDGQIAARHVGVRPETTLRAEMQKLSERVMSYTEADLVAWSFCFRQIGQYHGAGIFTGLGLLVRHRAQR
jgi:hypothetical protein